MKIENSTFKIVVDVEKTKEYYKSHLDDFCDCLYCKNYIRSLPCYSKELIKLLEKMGIDYATEGEAMHFNKNEDGTHFYQAFYHVVGEIINGDGVWNELEGKTAFGVSKHCDLLPLDFPRPAFQINLSFNLEWVLNE